VSGKKQGNQEEDEREIKVEVTSIEQVLNNVKQNKQTVFSIPYYILTFPPS
jgi:hypothetical protein